MTHTPLLAGDNEDVVEEEEVDLVPCCLPGEDATLFHVGCEFAAFHHPARG